MTLGACHIFANELLEDRGFSSRDVSTFNLPATRAVPVPEGHVDYAVFGELDAPGKIIQSAPYLTDLSSPHFKLKLATQQEVLGENFCIVGVQAYAPDQKFSSADKKQFRKGSFEPLSTRMLRVAEALGVESAALYGYSLGGDVAVQTSYDVHANPNRGALEAEGLGVVEYARSADRGFFKVVGAMSSSGGQFLENILASESDSLNQVWEVAADMSDKEKKAFDKKTQREVVRYWLGNISANLAITQGFGTDKSSRQLSFLLGHTDLPVVAGRQSDSKMITEEDSARLKASRAIYFEEANDHSADDNIRKSAGRILYFARTALVDV